MAIPGRAWRADDHTDVYVYKTLDGANQPSRVELMRRLVQMDEDNFIVHLIFEKARG